MNGSVCPKFNCSLFDVHELQPNPDISGIGVLIGFGTSAYLTLVFCTAYFLLDREGNTNAVDQLVIETLPALLGWRNRRASDKLSEALQNAVLTFSDLQIFRSISLAIIVDLVWFSYITHLATLTSLRRYFRERPALRLWRIVCMGITAGMLSYALIITAYQPIIPPIPGNPNQNYLGYPAWCLLHPHELDNAVKIIDSQYGPVDGDSHDSPYIALITTFLVASYFTRTIRLFPIMSDKIRNVLRTKPSLAFKNKLAHLKDRITWLALALGWGTMRVLEDRWGVASEILEQENAWGFSQVVALCLLILPLLAFAEIIYESIIGGTVERSQGLGSRANPTYGPIQSYQDFYQKRWYRKLLLLKYLLSLAVAGDLLVTFAWLDWTQVALRYSWFLSYVAIFYAVWVTLNIAIVWLYTIVCLSLGDLVSSVKRPRTVQRLRYTISKAQLRCIQASFWNGMIILLVGTSVAFDVRYKWYGSKFV